MDRGTCSEACAKGRGDHHTIGRGQPRQKSSNVTALLRSDDADSVEARRTDPVVTGVGVSMWSVTNCRAQWLVSKSSCGPGELAVQAPVVESVVVFGYGEFDVDDSASSRPWCA
jgi:hypothetical protein